MSTSRHSLLTFLFGPFIVLAGIVFSTQTLGQTPARSADFSKLAQAIAGGFPLDGTAYPGNDWCVAMESDPRTEWWYFTYNGQSTAHSVYYPARIRMITRLKDKTAGATNTEAPYIKFSSVFLGIDMGDPHIYGLVVPEDRKPSQQTKSNGGPLGPGKIEFPTTNTVCSSLQEVLGIVFEGWVDSWESIGDPLCQEANSNNPTNPCRGVVLPGGTLIDRETSDPGEGVTPTDANLMYWSFNGRDHKILRAILFLIKVYPLNDKDHPIYKYLMVGYGGSGGAG